MGLDELKARMYQIKDELKSLFESGSYDITDPVIKQRAIELQAEGVVLGLRFKEIRQEQMKAVAFVEGLIENEA